MKTYKLNNVEVSEDQVRELIKSNPELLEKKEVKGRYYFPKNGGDAYYFEDNEPIVRYSFSLLKSTGMFKTKKNALLAYDKQCAIVRCWKWAQENAPFEPDWGSIEEKKWHATFCHTRGYWYGPTPIWHSDFQEQFTLPHFKTKEDCERFIEANKADLELLFLK